jgi:uncharacterized protein (DUF1778 family)
MIHFGGDYKTIIDINGEEFFEFQIELPKDEYDALIRLSEENGYKKVEDFVLKILIDEAERVISFHEQLNEISD